VSGLRNMLRFRMTRLGSVDLKTMKFVPDELWTAETGFRAARAKDLAYYAGHKQLMELPDAVIVVTRGGALAGLTYYDQQTRHPD